MRQFINVTKKHHDAQFRPLSHQRRNLQRDRRTGHAIVRKINIQTRQ